MSHRIETTVVSAAHSQGLAQAIQLLHQGSVIAAPTDTVYGVICRYDHEPAVEALYAVKERPAQKALPILLGERSQVTQVVLGPLSPAAQILVQRFWPGPLTLVLPARPHLPSRLTAGGHTVGVRIPDHAILRQLARQAGPLASSSANRSGGAECYTAAQVLEQLQGRIPLILDGGETAHGVASTVVRVTDQEVEILRPGPIAAQVQEAVQARMA